MDQDNITYSNHRFYLDSKPYTGQIYLYHNTEDGELVFSPEALNSSKISPFKNLSKTSNALTSEEGYIDHPAVHFTTFPHSITLKTLTVFLGDSGQETYTLNEEGALSAHERDLNTGGHRTIFREDGSKKVEIKLFPEATLTSQGNVVTRRVFNDAGSLIKEQKYLIPDTIGDGSIKDFLQDFPNLSERNLELLKARGATIRNNTDGTLREYTEHKEGKLHGLSIKIDEHNRITSIVKFDKGEQIFAMTGTKKALQSINGISHLTDKNGNTLTFKLQNNIISNVNISQSLTAPQTDSKLTQFKNFIRRNKAQRRSDALFKNNQNDLILLLHRVTEALALSSTELCLPKAVAMLAGNVPYYNPLATENFHLKIQPNILQAVRTS
ncbi:MAG: hypothetical protein ACTSXQ_00175 [Alphaproteobacteria bacterium]